jgi:phosphoribosylamine--glycine ligase
MKVLLIGSGGREDAIAWALRRSPHLTELHCTPGNAGIERHADCFVLDGGIEGERGVEAIASLVEREGYDLVVVGPEAPLVAGVADRLRAAGTLVFGPSAAAARLEGSKVFAKEFMSRHGIPTAAYRVFDDAGAARAHLESDEATYPLVVKADGLAAGKGVILADAAAAAVGAAEGMLSGRDFGAAGRRVVVEERLVGREASFFVVTDGKRHVELATCQDYKRAHDGDAGPNTGGMGTYSPSAFLDDATRRELVAGVVRPTIRGMADEGHPYRGVLYIGVMLTDDGPKVLEYNARFGDPETQVLMPRLDGDWLTLMADCARGELDGTTPRWKDEACVCVVMASGGYPGAYAKGLPIEGIRAAEESDPAVVVFQAGTGRDDAGRIVTRGGRVLGVTALGKDVSAARSAAYAAVDRIHWKDEHHRTDIAADAVGRPAGSTG